MNLFELLREVSDCGKNKSANRIETVAAERGALRALSGKAEEGKTVLVTDKTCARLYFSSVTAALGFTPETVYISKGQTKNDCEAILQAANGGKTVIALGGGSVCNVAKLAASRMGVPLVVVCTAASTDDYAASEAEFFDKGRFVRVAAAPPRDIIADTDILSVAPKKLTASGYGTLLAKYTALADRRVASLVAEEPYCARTHDCILQALESGRMGTDKENGVELLMHALLIGGAERSGDACTDGVVKSVLEYLCLHGAVREADGRGLGMAAYFVYRLYPYVYAALKVRSFVQPEFHLKRWESKMSKKFGAYADEVLKIERQTGMHSTDKTGARIYNIYAHASEIIRQLNVTPDLHPFFETFALSGGSLRYEDGDVSRMQMRDALLYGKNLSANYNVLGILSDLQRLSEAVEEGIDV